MNYCIYHAESGIITSQVRDKSHIIDRPYVLGDYEPGKWYVKDNIVKLLPPIPTKSNHVTYRWNLADESWVIDTTLTEKKARKLREQMFSIVDKINPMWWNSMTQEQQAVVAAYRQAILDVTDQPGFPETIDWPTKPAWL